MISIIVAVAENNAIGKAGDLLCHLSSDLKHFKAVTSGHTVIMGRKTFDSLPKGALPNRRNIVITRNSAFAAEKVEVAHSLEEALNMAGSNAFIIGGEQIYSQALPFADKLFLTEIHADFPDADTFFPEINTDQWAEESRETFPADEKNQFPYSFVNLIRK